MSNIFVTCPGCGQVLAQAADDPRTEVECLWCGIKTPVPGREPSPTAVRAEPPPPRSRRREPAAPAKPTRPVEAPPQAEQRWFEQTPYAVEGVAPEQFDTAPSAPQPAPAPRTPPASPRAPVSDDEDSNPYEFHGPPDKPCPGCSRPLPAETVLCPSCNFDLEAGERRRKTYEPVRRTWEMGWPLPRRKRLFLIGQVLVLALGGFGVYVFGTWGALIGPWILFTAMTAFCLGTYARTDLSRTERGKIRLTLTWRVCFVERPTETLRLGEHEGVTSGKAPAPDFWDYVALIILLVMGVVLGILWWYFVIRPDSFFVALTRDHGVPDKTLYWGWDQEQAQDMEKTIRTVAFGGL